MDIIIKLIRIAVALGLVTALLVFGFFVFSALLAIACVTALLLWLRRQNVIGDDASHHTGGDTVSSQPDVTIIEGKAEEVTLPGAA